MKLTFKTRHNLDLTKELKMARQVAEFAIANRDKLSTKYVKHFGLRAAISNQILRKYGRNKKIKRVHSVPLTISGSHVYYKGDTLWISQLKLGIITKRLFKVKQVEFDKEFIYITHEVEEQPSYTPEKHIGVDLNTTGHCAVVAVSETGKVYKLGKKAGHTHTKYKNMRKKLQKRGKFVAMAKIKRREALIVKDLNHKVSRFIVNLALKEKGGVKLEKLKGIRKNRKGHKSFKYALNSWSYYQLGKFIEYKALLAGVPITYIQPAFTSKACSRCGVIGERSDKSFKCLNGHVDHADTNAAFNIGVWSTEHARLYTDRDVYKGDTATPQKV